MKQMLIETHFCFTSINIQENEKAKMFLKENGHRTVPQLYVNDIHINKKNTEEYTASELYRLISNAMLPREEEQDDWPWSDSGVEQGI